MNKWSPERVEAIRQFIDEYFMENCKSPTVHDIATGTSISKTSVQRYLTDMKEHVRSNTTVDVALEQISHAYV